MIKVSCGLIFNNDKLLLCKRNHSSNHGGLWEFPGGKLEKDEDLTQCLKRELKEELSMDVKVITHFLTTSHHYTDFSIELHSFICKLKEQTYSINEHEAIEWANPLQLLEWDLVPADIAIAKRVIQEFKHTLKPLL